jgi:hypothetical protein
MKQFLLGGFSPGGLRAALDPHPVSALYPNVVFRASVSPVGESPQIL